LLAVTASVAADDAADLIALDKEWGKAGMKGDSNAVAKLLADDLVSVSDSGIRDKQGELANNEPAPAGAKYEPTDYKVKFLDTNTAVMTHATKGEEAHYSMHVWSRQGGKWRVVATATAAAGSD
jgi:hypothetical protein